MNQKTKPKEEPSSLEGSLISNFIRLCKLQGVDMECAARELAIRLTAVSELKLPEA